ncbi:nuclear transport factor 2 family protein [Candidatus Bathyarchaeota archaeon]|nr:nuclear transport factor 2 family protein [Candidatus Bathyarchaeota archaeon]
MLRKQAAVEFLQLIVAGRIDEAYSGRFDPQGKHHSRFFPTGLRELKRAMIENHAEFPTKQLTVKNVLVDGDLVAVHSHILLRPGEPGLATVHLFRFRGEKIVEMWDVGQALPLDSPNKDGPF